MEKPKTSLSVVYIYSRHRHRSLLYGGWRYLSSQSRDEEQARPLFGHPASDVTRALYRIQAPCRRNKTGDETYGSSNLDSIAAQFYTAGVHYSAAIQPYALKLFFVLFLIDLLTTWIQFMAEGQLDPTHFIGRIFRHVFSGRLRLPNDRERLCVDVSGHPELLAHRCAISGLPGLSPQSVLDTGIAMTNTLLGSPSTTGILNNLELAIVSGFMPSWSSQPFDRRRRASAHAGQSLSDHRPRSYPPGLRWKPLHGIGCRGLLHQRHSHWDQNAIFLCGARVSACRW